MCDDCVYMLIHTHCDPVSLISVKNKGGLVKPAIDVITICKVTGKVYRMFKNQIPTKTNIMHLLILKATSSIDINKLFLNNSKHFF